MRTIRGAAEIALSVGAVLTVSAGGALHLEGEAQFLAVRQHDHPPVQTPSQGSHPEERAINEALFANGYFSGYRLLYIDDNQLVLGIYSGGRVISEDVLANMREDVKSAAGVVDVIVNVENGPAPTLLYYDIEGWLSQ